MSGSENSTNNIEVLAIEAQFIDTDPAEADNTPRKSLLEKRLQGDWCSKEIGARKIGKKILC